MAAHEASVGGGSDGARRPPRRPALSLPPCASVGSFSAATTAGSSADTSPGPLNLASALFPDAALSPAFHGSFTQLLVGAMGSPASSSAGGPSPFTVPPGLRLSPTTLLGSSSLFSPTGKFEMSHQQVLAQVTAQAVQSQYPVVNQADYSLPFSLTTSALTSQNANSSSNVTSTQEIPTLPSHTGNSDFQSNEVSQGLQTSALTVDKPADDGYNWRKYGQKAVKGGEYPRSYYKCTHATCPVKKKVERSTSGQIIQIIYRGQHNHQRPPKRRPKDGGSVLNEVDDVHEKGDTSTRSEPGSQDHSGNFEASNDGITLEPSIPRRGERGDQSSGSSDSEEDGDAEVRVDNGDARNGNANKRHVPVPAQRIIVQTTSDVDLLDDGYRWRKYGQKVIKGNPHPRSYYKCTCLGCDVKKHIERCLQDPKAVITTYEGKHSHDVPTGRNSTRAAVTANVSSSSTLPHEGQNTSSRSRASLRKAALHTAVSASSFELKEENEVI